MTANRIWMRLEYHTGNDLRYLTDHDYQTIKDERDEMIEAFIKLYPDVSEEWEDENGIYLRNIIERATGKKIEEVAK